MYVVCDYFKFFDLYFKCHLVIYASSKVTTFHGTYHTNIYRFYINEL
jgi:hypothetical protein